MIRQLKIARDGQELGAWPYDVVFALVRCGRLLPTDTFWIEGMDDSRPLSEALPPPPCHSKPATFLGRDDEDMPWVFYCRDGCTVIGPRPGDEILSLIFSGSLTDDNLIFIASGDRWMSVADFMRLLEKETPGTIATECRRIQAALSNRDPSAPGAPLSADNTDWIQTRLNLTTLSPHLGGAYLGWNAVKRFIKRLDDTKDPSA
jgi:hypothetical protein